MAQSTEGSALEEKELTLSSRAYNEILKKLLNNELSPGQLVNRRTLAKELDMSVAPVLEAIIQLESEGFLESIPRKGTQVRIYGKEDLFEQLVFREAIECQAARFYCGEPIRENKDKLLALAEDLNKTHPSSVEHWRDDLALHLELVELAQIDILVREFRKLIRLNTFFVLNRFVTMPTATEDTANHHSLIEALQTDDPDEAENVVRTHIELGREGLLRRMRHR